MDKLTALAHAARRGEPRALDAFIRTSYSDVWRLCAALVDESTADDLAQESFLRATRALGSFRGESAARTWVLAIARHTCMDELRARHRRRDRDGRILVGAVAEPVTPDPSDEVMLRDLLSNLEPDRLSAFVLTQMLGCSYEQAAAICDCPVGTIRSRVARARDSLIAALGESAQDDPRCRQRSWRGRSS